MLEMVRAIASQIIVLRLVEYCNHVARCIIDSSRLEIASPSAPLTMVRAVAVIVDRCIISQLLMMITLTRLLAIVGVLVALCCG